MLPVKEEKDGVSFKIRVQPRAAKNQVAGIFQDALRVRLTAPPVDGEANEACRAFLAALLSVSKSQVEILSGHTGRNKVIKIKGVGISEVQKLLSDYR